MRPNEIIKYCLSLCVLMFVVSITSAQEKFLAHEQAFIFEARSISQDKVQLNWTIAPDYYVYKYQLAVRSGQQAVKFTLPVAKAKHDEFFGDTEVYYQQLNFPVAVEPNKEYQVSYQGCAEKGLCYPLIQTTFNTDADGLVILENPTPLESTTSLWTTAQNQVAENNTQSQKIESTSTETSEHVQPANAPSISSSNNAQDQQWSQKLHQQSFALSLVIFIGLGCLLAFTPCSLPMLPILSSLLVRRHEGVKAIFISLTFVLSMATVYALLGVLAASAGSNFQRWLQQPFVLIAFSLIFVIFALNLFGLFELKLPQSWSNRLDGLQAKQRGGTLVGAGMMGMLSALLVGPCMTAPLAGTLLYISQTQNVMAGAILLFSLGLGMGIPLIMLTWLGQRAIPKPGMWMQYVRHVFAFLMLGLSIYFIRPLLSMELFNLLLLAVVIGLLIYLIGLIQKQRGSLRYIAIVILIGVSSLSIWQSVKFWHYQQMKAPTWQVVSNHQQLEQALLIAQKNQQAVVIDLYADWCIACQPLEREVWAAPDVQSALNQVVKIKLDLSDYHPEQQNLLKKWQLLGPPTALFIAKDGQEQRELRLTGSFNRQQLQLHLDQLQ